MSRLKASTILSRSPMAWLEKLFINFSTHLSSGRCASLLSQSLSCDFLGWQHCHHSQYNHMLFSLWPMKSLWSHRESVHLGRSASGTHHIENSLDWLPWGVISHLWTQRGFMTTTTETHSYVYGFCPRCAYKIHPSSPASINLSESISYLLIWHIFLRGETLLLF